MAKKSVKGVYYVDLRSGVQDEKIHNPILSEGDSRFINSQAGKDSIHRLVNQFGLSESEAIALLK